MNSPRVYNYGKYSSNNYGSSRAVQVGNMTLYFSYDTVIAFSSPKTGLVIRKNDWSTTTGKHLNAINPDKKVRINGEEFEQRLEELLQSYELVQNGGMQN
jgi:hypothetical protein